MLHIEKAPVYIAYDAVGDAATAITREAIEKLQRQMAEHHFLSLEAWEWWQHDLETFADDPTVPEDIRERSEKQLLLNEEITLYRHW